MQSDIYEVCVFQQYSQACQLSKFALETQDFVFSRGKQACQIQYTGKIVLRLGTTPTPPDSGLLIQGFLVAKHLIYFRLAGLQQLVDNKIVFEHSVFIIQMLESNVHVTNVAPGPVLTNVSKNALIGDGSKFGKTDELIANGMSVKRYEHRYSYSKTLILINAPPLSLSLSIPLF